MSKTQCYSTEFAENVCKFIDSLPKGTEILCAAANRWLFHIFYRKPDNNNEAKAEIKWIDAKELSPSEDGVYYVITDYRHNDVYDMARYENGKWQKDSNILFWMPIPYHPDYPINFTHS